MAIIASNTTLSSDLSPNTLSVFSVYVHYSRYTSNVEYTNQSYHIFRENINQMLYAISSDSISHQIKYSQCLHIGKSFIDWYSKKIILTLFTFKKLAICSAPSLSIELSARFNILIVYAQSIYC